MIDTRETAEDYGWNIRQTGGEGWTGEKRFASGFMSRPIGQTCEELLDRIDEIERLAKYSPTMNKPVVIRTGGVVAE